MPLPKFRERGANVNNMGEIGKGEVWGKIFWADGVKVFHGGGCCVAHWS